MTVPAIHGYLRAVGLDPAASGPGDADLLARFAETGDETAFELLVWRHAPLIEATCRAVLRDRHAAEDATQATFLILARKAKTFAGCGSVVGWLYRVARRTAVRLAAQRARQPRVGDLTRVPAPETPECADAGAIWAEVERLPERYRVPVLLCFFEGLTHTEAARRTGVPVGTVAGRLARAKVLLARRFARRGLVLGAVALPVASGAFVGATARAATAFATGCPIADLVPPSVLELAQGATFMTATLLKTAAAVLAVCSAAATVWAFVPGGAPPAGLVRPLLAPVVEPVAAPVPKGAGKAGDGIADARQRVRSRNNLKTLMLAVYNYHDANGFFPTDISDKNGELLLSWRVRLLPYLEQEGLYKELKLDERWDSETNKKALGKMPDVFRVGIEEKGATKTYYQVFAGPGSAFEPGKRINIPSITDGTSNTIGVVEAGPPVEWTKPADIAYDSQKAFPKLDGPFRNVLMVGMMDGDAASLKPDLGEKTLHTLVTRSGGEVVDFNTAKADIKAFSKEDKDLALKLQKENIELLKARAELMLEWHKLTAERAKKSTGAELSLEKLIEQQLLLREEMSSLKNQIEAMKREPEKK